MTRHCFTRAILNCVTANQPNQRSGAKPTRSSWKRRSVYRVGPAAQAKRRGGGGGGEGDDHHRKGVEFADAKQFDKAIEEFSKGIEAAPDNPEAYHDRGTAYRAAGVGMDGNCILTPAAPKQVHSPRHSRRHS